MRLFTRAAAAFAVVALSFAAAPATSAEPAETTHDATETFAETLPCLGETSYFEITIVYNSIEKFDEEQGEGHFTGTGTFTAAPIKVKKFERERHEDHVHLIPVRWVAAEGPTWSGKFTANGTRQVTDGGTVTESFHFRANGTSSEGDQFAFQATFHQTEVKGVVRVLRESGSCL